MKPFSNITRTNTYERLRAALNARQYVDSAKLNVRLRITRIETLTRCKPQQQSLGNRQEQLAEQDNTQTLWYHHTSRQYPEHMMIDPAPPKQQHAEPMHTEDCFTALFKLIDWV